MPINPGYHREDQMIALADTLESVPQLSRARIHMFHPPLALFEDYFNEATREIPGDLSSPVNCWFITPTTPTENSRYEPLRDGKHPTTTAHGFRLFTFEIEGYMSADSDIQTERRFWQIIDSVLETFEPNRGLNLTVEDSSVLRVAEVGFTNFGGEECHYVKFTIQTQTRSTNVNYR